MPKPSSLPAPDVTVFAHWNVMGSILMVGQVQKKDRSSIRLTKIEMANIAHRHKTEHLPYWKTLLNQVAFLKALEAYEIRKRSNKKLRNSPWDKWMKRNTTTIPARTTVWEMATIARTDGPSKWSCGPLALYLTGYYSHFIELFVRVRGQLTDDRLMRLVQALDQSQLTLKKTWTLSPSELKKFETAWKTFNHRRLMTEDEGALVALQAVAKRYSLGVAAQRDAIIWLMTAWLAK